MIGQTAEDRQADLETILATTPADFKAYAETIRSLMDGGKGIKTALGGADAIKASGLFEEGNVKEL